MDDQDIQEAIAFAIEQVSVPQRLKAADRLEIIGAEAGIEVSDIVAALRAGSQDTN